MVHRKSALLIALATLTVLVSPAAAQAAAPAVSAPTSHSNVVVKPDSTVLEFTGGTYPDTSAGLAACDKEGPILQAQEGANKWFCLLGNPDAGLYGLWLGYTICKPVCILGRPAAREG